MTFYCKHRDDDFEIWSPPTSDRDLLYSSDMIDNFWGDGNLNSMPQLLDRLIVMREMFKEKFGDTIPISRLDKNGMICGIINRANSGFVSIKDESGYVERQYDDVSGFSEGMVVWAEVKNNKFSHIHVPGHPLQKTKHANFVAALISDTHIGSPHFQTKSFENFIEWLNTSEGSRVEYLIHAGDMIDNRSSRAIEEIRNAADMFDKIPEHIRIIICPGNHDLVGAMLPQMPATLPTRHNNVFFVSNPSLLKIKGYDILLTHGQGLDGIIYNEKIDKNDSDIAAMMRHLVRSRHVCPSTEYGSTSLSDNLIIETIPDMLIAGHVHKSCNMTLDGIRYVNPGCWLKLPDRENIRWSEPGNVMILDGDSVKNLKFS